MYEQKKHITSELKELIELAQKNDNRALAKIVQQNMGLVYYVTNQYKGLCKGALEESDIVSEGVIGLIEGIRRFDLTSENTFATYVLYWIKQKCIRFLDMSSTNIRFPCGKNQEIRHYNKANEYYSNLPKDLKQQKLKEHFALKADRFVEDIQKVKMMTSIASLNRELLIDGDSPGEELLDFVEAPNSDFTKEIELKADFDKVYKIIEKNFTPRQQYVLYQRYGLKGCEQRSLEEIGMQMSLTRERIRQIEAKTLRKLKFLMKKDGLNQELCY